MYALHLLTAWTKFFVLREIVQARFRAQRLLRVKLSDAVRRKAIVIYLIRADIIFALIRDLLSRHLVRYTHRSHIYRISVEDLLVMSI